MVSKARLDLPEPDSPVNTISRSRGSSTLMFLRLCSRAPRTLMTDCELRGGISGSHYRETTTVAFSVQFCGELGAQNRPARSSEPLTGVTELAAEVGDLVAEAGRVLEAKVGGGLVHLLLEGLDEPGELLLGQGLEVALDLVPLALAAPVAPGNRCRLVGPQQREDVSDRLADRLRVDPVLGVVGQLQAAAPLRLADRPLHRIGHPVGVHHHLAVDVAGR